MAKNIKRIVLSDKMPNNKHIAQAEPQDSEKINLKIYKDKKWIPIAGSGNNTTVNKYISDPNAPMLTTDIVYHIFNSKAQELNINPSTLTEEQVSQLVDSMSSVKFAAPKQGNAVLTNVVVEEQQGIFTFQCDDGSYITLADDTFVGLRPDLDGYIIWKTTKDKLPIRESQEEPNPGGGSLKSVKSGPSLKIVDSGGVISPTDPSIEVVYTVMNNNTGEIVDPLELHKLTDVIYEYSTGSAWWISTVSWRDQYSEEDTVSSWISIGNSSRPDIVFCFYMYNYILQYPHQYYQLSGTWQSMSD